MRKDTGKEDDKNIQELILELHMESEKILKKLKWYLKKQEFRLE